MPRAHAHVPANPRRRTVTSLARSRARALSLCFPSPFLAPSSVSPLLALLQEHRQAGVDYDAIARRRGCGLVCPASRGGGSAGTLPSAGSPRARSVQPLSPSPMPHELSLGDRSPAARRPHTEAWARERTPLRGANKAFSPPASDKAPAPLVLEVTLSCACW